jgi:hypothetical protein
VAKKDFRDGGGEFVGEGVLGHGGGWGCSYVCVPCGTLGVKRWGGG